MTTKEQQIGSNVISFLNRDHVVLVTVDGDEIMVTTTLGMKISLSASQPIVAKFVDELASNVESNFVSIRSRTIY